ncbi:MAG: sugar phosphate isomerase/epimerase family protein [Planctomycetota bacterium]
MVETINYVSYFGYEGIEILGDVPHITDNLNVDDYKYLKQKINDSHLIVSNINTNDCKEFFSVYNEEPFFTAQKDVFELKLRQVKRNLEVAKILDCRNISITAGSSKGWQTRKEALDNFFTHLDEILIICPENISVCIEPEPGHIIENLNDLNEIFKNFSNKNLGINLDIGHLYCTGEKIEVAFEKFSDKIFHIHFEDIKDNKHYHLIPGHGNLPLKNILDFLRKNYEGFLCIELYTYKDNPVQACYESILYLTSERDL